MEQHNQTVSLLARIEKLEKQNKRFKWLAISPAIFFSCLLLIAAGISYEGVFKILDRPGNVRGSLTTSPNSGQGKLILSKLDEKKKDGTEQYSSKQMVVLEGGVGENSQGLSIYDSEGRKKIFLGVIFAEMDDGEGGTLKLESPGLFFYNEAGGIQYWLDVSGEHWPYEYDENDNYDE